MAYNSKFTGAQIDALLDASEAMKTSKEDVANKVTSINADADDTHYPTAKAVKGKFGELEQKLYGKIYELDFSSINPTTGFLTPDDIWTLAGTHRTISCKGYDKVEVTAKNDLDAFIAFLSSNETPTTEGQSSSICPGTSRVTITKGNSIVLDIPTSCNYIYYAAIYGGVYYTPQSSNFITEGELLDLENSIQNNREKINDLEYTVNEKLKEQTELIDLALITPTTGFLTPDGIWTLAGTHRIVNVGLYKKIRIIPREDNSSFVAFLSSNETPTTEGQSSSICPGTSRVTLNTDTTLEIPSTCKYIYIATQYQSTLFTPKSAMFVKDSYIDIIKDECDYKKARVVIAAHDSTDRDKRMASFICDGVNDQDTIKEAFESLAPFEDLYFCKGNYIIDSFFEQEGEPSYVIRMPYGSLNRHNLICEGSIMTKSSLTGDGVGDIVGGAIFRISNTCYSSLDSNKNYSIITCGGNSGTYRQYPVNGLSVHGIGFVLPDNTKKIICVDGRLASYINVSMMMATCSIDQSNLKVGSTDCIAIRCTQGSNMGANNKISHSFVWGFYEGYALGGEHLICEDIGARFCNYGFTFNNYDMADDTLVHPITLINCCDECNFNLPYFGKNKGQSVTMIDFNTEWKNQYRELGGDYAKEEMPGSWHGNISIHHSGEFNSEEEPFWSNDGSGKNVHTTNLSQNTIVDSDDRRRYAPNYGQQVFDITLNKLLTCIDTNIKKWVDVDGNIVE